LREAVAGMLARMPASRASALVALSGGRDSVALLDATQAAAGECGVRLVAGHVHHGLSRHADAWTAFCAALCTERGIPLCTQHVAVPVGEGRSLEASAREARYAALAAMARAQDVALVLLAQHADDQAETLLLQLLRGAGPRGLAAMPGERVIDGIIFARPWLALTRAAIDAYVCSQGLRYIDDESNDDHRLRRNAVRQHVAPVLRRLGGYPMTFARAAAHQADAACLLDELAAIDAASAMNGCALHQEALAALPEHRARNLLRWFLRSSGLRAPGTMRLEAMRRQLARARGDARVCLLHDGREIGVSRGRIVVHPPAPACFDRRWQGEDVIALPHGTLRLLRERGGVLDRERLFAQPVEVRARRGGERFCAGPGRPRRALKLVLQEAGVAPWERGALPLVFAGDVLAAVPGIGVDPAFHAAPGGIGWDLVWQPAGGP
jgi:tRNA(Ile)-lysidine synthase